MKRLTKEALASMLDGNERRDEITKEQEALAKENNLVVLFPYSDDGLEVRGAIDDELGAYDGGDFALLKAGEFFKEEDDEPDVYHKAEDNMIVPLADETQPEARRKIALAWIGTSGTKAWNMTTELPHAEFAIKEDGDIWADGIVIDLDEIQ